MNQKDTLHYLRIIEIGKSKGRPVNVKTAVRKQ